MNVDIKSIDKAIKYIAEEYLQIFKDVVDSTIGKNTNLSKESEVTINEGDTYIINLEVNDYIQYIESGRKPHAKKVPIKELREWAKRRGIDTDNSTLYAIQQSIYNEGIKPRNIIDLMYNNLDKNIDKMFDMIFEEINNIFEKIIK